MKLAALLLLVWPLTANDAELQMQWWEQGEFGACTKTDIEELGACGKLEVKRKPDWNKK
jgi:hypothetical protein